MKTKLHLQPLVSSLQLFTLALLVALPVHASLITNGSFETGDFTGWTASGTVFVGVGNNSNTRTLDGTDSADFGPGSAATDGFISQTVNVVPGQSYELSFLFGKYASGSGTSRLLATVTGTGTLLNQTVSDTTGGWTSADIWNSFDFNFVADSSTATISFADQSSGDTAKFDTYLDAVNVVPMAAVPDAGPGLPLTGITLAGLLTIAWVRRRAAVNS